MSLQLRLELSSDPITPPYNPETPDYDITVDDTLDIESGNPISNRAVTEAILNIADDMTGMSNEIHTLSEDVTGLREQINHEAHFRGYLSTDAKIQSLDATPNDFAYSAESGTVWVYDVSGWVNTGEKVPDQLTPASDSIPLINGEASPGVSNTYARGDHRHPTDTTRASVAELDKVKSDVEKLEIITSDTGDMERLEQVINHNTITRVGVVTHSISGVVGESPFVGFLAALYFATPDIIPENYSTFPDDMYFKGDSTDDGKFIPEANTRYTIVFDYDGYVVNAYVSGVSRT
jgi:hypothetical protein